MAQTKIASLERRIPVRRPVTEYPRGHVLRIDFAHVARVLQVKADVEDVLTAEQVRTDIGRRG